MTIQANNPRAIFNCDGVTTVFPVNIQAYQGADFTVMLTSPAGAESQLTLNSDYALVSSGTLSPPYWSLTTLAGSPYAAGYTLQVFLNPVQQQVATFVQGQAFPSLAVQTAFDRLTQMVQRLQDEVNRCLRAPDGDKNPVMLLPTAIARANAAPAFDGSGNTSLAVIPTAALTQNTFNAFAGLTPPYARTAAEIAVSVTPTNLNYLPGDVRRYGADPTGVSDSASAWATAISCNDDVFDGYPGGGSYLFNSTVALSRYPLRIRGAMKNIGSGQGTSITLAGAAGSGAAIFHATAFTASILIEGITFLWAVHNTGQIGLLFDVDLRSARIRDCAFMGSNTTGDTTTGIKLAGGGTFSGDVTIEKNYIAGVQTGIYFGTTCSTCRVLHNELYCNAAIASSFGVNNQSTVGGVILIGNSFEAWVKAIYSPNGAIRQLFNYHEGNGTYDFDWGTSTNNISIGDYNTGAGSANYNYNNSSGNFVLGGAYGISIDSNYIAIYRGIKEQNRAVANGHQIPRTFAAGNFTGGGGWTVTSGEDSLDMLVVNGNEATYYFTVLASTVTGGAAALSINLASFGFTAAFRTRENCWISDNGTGGTGVVEILANGTSINIYKDASTTANWSASTTNTSVVGKIKFPITYSVN